MSKDFINYALLLKDFDANRIGVGCSWLGCMPIIVLMIIAWIIEETIGFDDSFIYVFLVLFAIATYLWVGISNYEYHTKDKNK